MAKRGQLCPYACTTCGKRCEAPPTSVLALLGLCQEHQEERFARGLAEQKSALARGAARG